LLSFIFLLLFSTDSLAAKKPLPHGPLNATCTRKLKTVALREAVRMPFNGKPTFVKKSRPSDDKLIAISKANRAFEYQINIERSFREMRDNVFLLTVDREQKDKKGKTVTGSEFSMAVEIEVKNRHKECKIADVKRIDLRRGAF
jgi:hypothetical protein